MKSTIISIASGLVTGAALAFALKTATKPKVAEFTQNIEENQEIKEKQAEQNQKTTLQSKFVIPKPKRADSNDYKLVIGINMEVQTTKREVCSILGDAVIKAVAQAACNKSRALGQWYYFGQAKICLKIPDSAAMEKTIEAAKAKNLPYSTIEHKGKIAATAFGPDNVKNFENVTNGFKLF